MATKKIQIATDSGDIVEASAPVIVSASRSTDIPAFYADWFFHRLDKGYSIWTNPFNGVPSYISYRGTRFIVFWSKNPRPLLPYLDKLAKMGIGCYIQYTLNDYEAENLEKGVPPLAQRIDTFKALVDKLGIGRVVWRFDPLILTDTISIGVLLDKIVKIGDRLKGYTEKLVFSFVDIGNYKKVKQNLSRSGIKYRVWDDLSMLDFVKRLAVLNKERGWNFELATCGEKIDLSQFGVAHNRCVDDRLIIHCAWQDAILMDHLNVEIHHAQPSLFGGTVVPEDAIPLPDGNYAVKKKDNRDKGQRQFCGCIVSKDIGQYNTCPHLCEYCYANSSKDTAVANWRSHKQDPFGEKILG